MANETTAQAQWMTRPDDERYRSLEDLRFAVRQRRNQSHAIKGTLTDAAWIDGGGVPFLQVQDSGSLLRYEPTHHAFGHACALVGAPADFLRRLPVNQSVEALNYCLADRDAHKPVSYLVQNNGGQTLRAVTGPDYGRIWDDDVVALAMTVRDATGMFNPPDWSKQPSGLFASDRDVFIFLVSGGSIVHEGPRAELNLGLYLWNSETGDKRFGFKVFTFNHVCGNLCVWDVKEMRQFTMVHRRLAPERFRTDARPALEVAASELGRAMGPLAAKVRAAQLVALPAPAPSKEFTAFGREKWSLTGGEISGAIDRANHEEGQCATVWDFAQGLTAYARDLPYKDTALEICRKAGAIVEAVTV